MWNECILSFISLFSIHHLPHTLMLNSLECDWRLSIYNEFYYAAIAPVSRYFTVIDSALKKV